MQARIDSLERQLEQANERDRENRRIIAALTTRIAEIEAPETPDTHPEGAQPRSGTGALWRLGSSLLLKRSLNPRGA